MIKMTSGIVVGHLSFKLFGLSLAQIRKGGFWALNTAGKIPPLYAIASK